MAARFPASLAFQVASGLGNLTIVDSSAPVLITPVLTTSPVVGDGGVLAAAVLHRGLAPPQLLLLAALHQPAGIIQP